MGAPERTAKMETSEKMKQSEDSSTSAVEVVDSSPKDQFAWAQFMHDSQYFDFSPKGLNFSPRLDSPSNFQNLSAICQSPMFAADQWKFLFSPRTTTVDSETSTVFPDVEPAAAEPPPGPSVSDQVKSLNLSKLSSSERGVTSATTSCESEGPCCSGEVKLRTCCAESTAPGHHERTRRRKRTTESDERDPEEELVDGTSEAEGMEESKERTANKPSRSKQQKVKGAKRMREPRIAIKTRTDVDIMEDGYKWRKYGQKPVKNSPHPRNYYRCTTANCPVRKRVERSTEDPGLVVTSYEGTHTHPKVNHAKRTASGSFAPVEAAESLSESLNQHQTRQAQQAGGAASISTSAPNQFPLTFPGSWPPMNRPGTDNVGLMMAYQIVRLQWELQAKTQQFLSYNAGLQPKTNPFLDPFALQNMQAMPDLSVLMSSGFGESSDSDAELERMQRLPTVPEALNSGSLLARRAAHRAGSPLNPNLQTSNVVKMQQLLAQAMAGLQQAAVSDPHCLGDGGHQLDQGQ